MSPPHPPEKPEPNEHTEAWAHAATDCGETVPASTAVNVRGDAEREWAPPSEFDGFLVLRRLGAGGMGSVYLAREQALERHVAIKFVAGGLATSAQTSNFMLEARALARLQHPNVAAIYRVGEVEGAPYLCYEYIAGEGLDRADAPVPWTRAFAIARGLAQGLAATHRRGLLHRDIKPANIIVDARTGAAKLIDFGIAQLDRAAVVPRPGVARAPDETAAALGDGPTGVMSGVAAPGLGEGELTTLGDPGLVLVGTPRYLAPELWRGEVASVRSDIYALGLVLHELCAGPLPAPAEDATRSYTYERFSERDVPPLLGRRPDVPEDFARLIDRCVAREPSARFASVDQIVRALEELTVVYRTFRLLPEPDQPEPPLYDDDLRFVTQSWERIAPRMEAFTTRFYERLFAQNAGLRRLFPADLRGQRRKLADALALTVRSLGEHKGLITLLEQLGETHARYSVTEAHFTELGAALMATIERFEGDRWNEATAAAWASAYGKIAHAMQRGLRRGYARMGP